MARVKETWGGAAVCVGGGGYEDDSDLSTAGAVFFVIGFYCGVCVCA